MAARVLPPSNGEQTNSKGRRSERRGRRERCRTQVYEGQYDGHQPMDDLSSDYKGFRPRHKSCDTKVELKQKRRSLPSGPDDFIDSESDSPGNESRKWARRPRRTRNNGSGNSSGGQQIQRNPNDKNLSVPETLCAQPSSDSAIYMRQRAQNNNSNGSRGKFQKLEERRRKRLDMAPTSDEEGGNLPRTPPSPRQPNSIRAKPQKLLPNGRSDDTLCQPQIAFAQRFTPAGFTDSSMGAFNFGAPVSPKLEMDSEELMTKKPVSLLKAQFEKQMQTPPSTPPHTIDNRPTWGLSPVLSSAPRRLSADSIPTSSPLNGRQTSRWQPSKQFEPPSVSIKPVKCPPVVNSCSTKTKLYQPLNDSQCKPFKDHNFNDADSLDELLESNKDYLGFSKSENKPTVKTNIKQTLKSMQAPSRKGVTELGAAVNQRRTSDPLVFPTNVSENTKDNQQTQITKPAWPRNILSSLSPAIAIQAKSNSVQSNVFSIQPNQSKILPSRSPISDTMDDLWIPKKGPITPVKSPIRPVSSKVFSSNTPAMVVSGTISCTSPTNNIQVMNLETSNTVQLVNQDGLMVPSQADGMFSDVDYNIEVSERVKKWEGLMQEKTMPSRKSQIPDKINLVEDNENISANILLSPRSRLFPGARLSVIDEKTESKNLFGNITSDTRKLLGPDIFSNSGGDLLLNQNQMWTYPGNTQNMSLTENQSDPLKKVKSEQQASISDQPRHSDWYFKGYAKEAKSSPVKLESHKPQQLSPIAPPKYSTGSYGSSPKMTRKIVYEPLKSDGSEARLNPFFNSTSSTEITNPLYTPVKSTFLSSPPKKTHQSKNTETSSRGIHRRQDSDEQIWKEIERMTMYARAIAGAASSSAKVQTNSSPKVQKSPTRRSAYEPLTSQKISSDHFVPLSIDVGSPKKTHHERFSNPYDNIPLVTSANVYQSRPSTKKITTTKSIQYQHVPVTDKYQRPEALDEVLEEITTSLEKNPFSPKTKSPAMSSSSQWSTGSPDKPPLSPDGISMSTSQRLHMPNDPNAGRPSSMAFPHAQSSLYSQGVRDNERQPKFMNLAHGREYQLDHNLLKQKLLGTGLVDHRSEDDQYTDTGSGKAIDSDSGSQKSMTHINNALKELRYLANDVESKIDMIKTRLVTTKEEDLDTVLMTLRRCSSNLASAKSGYVGSAASAKNRKTKLNDALSELERIYESLDLANADLTGNKERRDYSTSQGSQWSITSMTDISSLGSYPHSSSDANLSDYNKWQSSSFKSPHRRQNFYSNDGLEQLTQALENSAFPENSNYLWRGRDGEETPRASTYAANHQDDLVNRRFQHQTESKAGVDLHTPTEALSALSSEESGRRNRSRRKEVDLTDEGSYRKIRTKSATRADPDSPIMSSSSTDYLSQRGRSYLRNRLERDSDTQDDVTYKNLRKDATEHPKPPPRSSSLHRRGRGKSDEESDSEARLLCNAETQTCNVDGGDSDNESDWKVNKRQGRSKERSYANRKLAKEEQKRRRSLGRGVAKMIERFSSSEDERQPKRRLKQSRSAPDLTEQALYSDAYNSKGEIMSTETDTNKEEEQQDNKLLEERKYASIAKSTSTKSQTPRTVKHRNESKSRTRSNNLSSKNDRNNDKQATNTSINNAQNKSLLKAKAADVIISSSDQTPLGSSCEGSPAPARLLIHRKTKRVPLATISTTSTSGEDSASGSRTSLNATMALPQGSVIKRQTPADLPSGHGVKLRSKKSNLTKHEREERSKSVPELLARFETDPIRLKTLLGTLRKSISAGVVPVESVQKKSFYSEPNLRDSQLQARIVSKETLLLNWNLKEDSEKEIFC